jgi:hypothetical protein
MDGDCEVVGRRLGTLGVGCRGGVLIGCADSLLALLVHLRSGAGESAERPAMQPAITIITSDHHAPSRSAFVGSNPTVCLQYRFRGAASEPLLSTRYYILVGLVLITRKAESKDCQPFCVGWHGSLSSYEQHGRPRQPTLSL